MKIYKITEASDYLGVSINTVKIMFRTLCCDNENCHVEAGTLICDECGQPCMVKEVGDKLTATELGNVFEPQPCPVVDCPCEADGDCGEDDVKWDTCERRRKYLKEND